MHTSYQTILLQHLGKCHIWTWRHILLLHRS